MLERMKLIWRSSEDTGFSGLRTFIEDEQKRSWDEVGLIGRFDDPNYPLSGKYDPPEEVEADVASLLMMAGVVVGRPIITKEPLTSIYQEKLTLPILADSLGRLRLAEQISEEISSRVLLATVPSGALYPNISVDDKTKNCAIVYNANLLFTLLASANLLEKICACPDAKRGETEGAWADGYSVCVPQAKFSEHADEIQNFASMIATLVRFGHPYVPSVSWFGNGPFAPRLVVDFYTFMLAHEVGHIKHGHSGFPSERGGDRADLHKEELLADVEGYALYANATLKEFGGNFGCYIHVSFLFYIMGLIYRAVNFFQKNDDYGLWTPESLWGLYFPKANTGLYLHPLGRLHLLRDEIKKRGASSPAEMQKWDSHIHSMFDNLWRSMCQSLFLHEAGPAHPIWKKIEEHHRVCLETEGEPS